jgi:hypothetical protein
MTRRDPRHVTQTASRKHARVIDQRICGRNTKVLLARAEFVTIALGVLKGAARCDLSAGDAVVGEDQECAAHE